MIETVIQIILGGLFAGGFFGLLRWKYTGEPFDYRWTLRVSAAVAALSALSAIYQGIN